jgi:hypothetical protein
MTPTHAMTISLDLSNEPLPCPVEAQRRLLATMCALERAGIFPTQIKDIGDGYYLAAMPKNANLQRAEQLLAKSDFAHMRGRILFSQTVR